MSWKYLDTEILKRVELFQNLSERSLQEIIVVMTMVDVKRGASIFHEGDEGDALFLVLEGEVRISKNIPGVGEEALAFLPEGS
ncbi:MAG: cyclic nucleotide-binding domain-containing protein, partial [Myxococcota bacterium]